MNFMNMRQKIEDGLFILWGWAMLIVMAGGFFSLEANNTKAFDIFASAAQIVAFSGLIGVAVMETIDLMGKP